MARGGENQGPAARLLAPFALSENTQAFLPILKQAVLRRGFCERLYVDNGAPYRSDHLALVCTKLGIALIHARPYQPQGKGKIERWFKTLRAQLLIRLSPQDTASLEALNRRLSAWMEHHGLGGQTALERWAQTAQDVRFPEPHLDLDDLFLFEAKRKVQKDRTVSLNGVLSRGRRRAARRAGHPALRSQCPGRAPHPGLPRGPPDPSGSSPARPARAKPPSAARSPPPCILASTGSSTCRFPPAMSWTCINPSAGNWACPPSATAPAPFALSARRSRA